MGRLRLFITPVERLGTSVLTATQRLGAYMNFVFSIFLWLPRRPLRWRLLFNQMEFIGVESLNIIILTSLFFGMIMSLQGSFVAYLFNAQGMVGMGVAVAAAREGAPVLTTLMIIGRCGSAMAAELGTMRVTEQIDALESMAVSPVHYLAVPRMVAAVVMLPLLTVLSDVLIIAGSYLVMVKLEGVDSAIFIENVRWFLDPLDIFQGMIKAFVFGFILTTIGCFMGFTTDGGAKGVGQATTRSVVVTSVAILVADYFLAMVLHHFETTLWSVVGG